MVEQGFVHPGTLVVASDSHSNMYGALGAVGTPVVRTDAAAIWATGTTWWSVPRTVKVVLDGALRPGVTGKDVIITLCGLYNSGEVLNAAVEFHGSGIAGLSLSERLTISNMTTEWGALVGWFPFDETTAAYLRQRAAVLAARGHADRLNETLIAGWEAEPPEPDADADYAAEIIFDLGDVSPHVSGPDTVAVMRPATEIAQEKIKVDKAYLLSCTNARLDDLVEAAAVLRGKRVADGVQLYLAAASAEVQTAAEADGAWGVLLEAGARALPPGCGACIGLGVGLLEPGEVGISATNRNFKGRMGSRDAKAYLASPAVVAASAAAGFITGPEELGVSAPAYRFTDLGWRPVERQVAIREGFPATLQGRALLLPADNLNTDGIYGKDVTYRDDLTPEQMAAYAMANYDPRFQDIAADGDILIAGRNFGTGSSREQAATALKFRGIRMVIAASFSQTYLRNAFNNAFICLESASLAEAVRSAFAEEAEAGTRTIPAGELEIDFRSAKARWRGVSYPLSPLGPAAQELVLAGGLEALTRVRLGM
jgi:homoaconitate hydratase